MAQLSCVKVMPPVRASMRPLVIPWFALHTAGTYWEVAKAIRELWPQREIIVAADDDAFTDGNPGQTKATAAAKAIRAKLAVPRSGKVIGAIDFNDLAKLEGLSAVVRGNQMPPKFHQRLTAVHLHVWRHSPRLITIVVATLKQQHWVYG